MGNKLTGILTGIGCGLMLVGLTSPLWMRDVYTDTRRVKLESGKDVAVSLWNDGSRIEIYTGSILGSCLTDSDNDGTMDSRFDFYTAPRRWPMKVNHPVTSEDQENYKEAIGKFDSSEQMGLKGIYSSITKIF